MNLELYEKLAVKGKFPCQRHSEWPMFLLICYMYIKRCEIEEPVVVELGTGRNRQKEFYEQLLGAHHIGIDICDKYSVPDILGDSHDPKTLALLLQKLDGRKIDILFIDAGHCYESVKKDFELYAPLCDGLVAFHDIETYRYKGGKERGVSKLWDELNKALYKETGEYKNFQFLSIHQCYFKDKGKKMGIGIIIKK